MKTMHLARIYPHSRHNIRGYCIPPDIQAAPQAGQLKLGGTQRGRGEPNLSLFDSTPIAYGLQLLYKKRWIARWLQECGMRLWVDHHISSKFRELNKLGVPTGYNAFATRGLSEYPEILLDELEVAKEISGCDNPNLIVYVGGNRVKEICWNHNLLYVEQHMVRIRESREEVKNGKIFRRD